MSSILFLEGEIERLTSFIEFEALELKTKKKYIRNLESLIIKYKEPR